MQDALVMLLSLLFLVCLIGVLVPLGKFFSFLEPFGRKHYAVACIVCFILVGVFAPEPTPEELAAREAKEAAEAAANMERQHAEVLRKAEPAMQYVPEYTRSEYPDTYRRVGAEVFTRLGELEPAAIYAAASSRQCDTAKAGAVSDISKPNKPIWFVDCENGNRFMIDLSQAEAALERFKTGDLQDTDLGPSCTIDSVRMCKASDAQRAAANKEIEFVSFCDLILEQALVSPSSLDLHNWKYGMGEGDLMVVERPFDSQNAFGANIRSHYRCEIDAAAEKIESFTISGPMGSQKVI